MIQDFGIGTFSDARIWEDNVVLGINGPDFGYLQTLHTSEILSVSDFLGTDAQFIARGGLFEGSIGVYGVSADGTSFSLGSHDVNGTSAVPEPQSWVMMLLAMIITFLCHRVPFLRHFLPRCN